MTASLHVPTGHQHPALAALWAYLADVTTALGIGLESCTIDHDSPVSAYIALDEHLPGYPGRDVALLWDEIHGWAAAIETHSGEDLITVRYLGGPTIVPLPEDVARFVVALREDDHRIGCLDRRASALPPAWPSSTSRSAAGARREPRVHRHFRFAEMHVNQSSTSAVAIMSTTETETHLGVHHGSEGPPEAAAPVRPPPAERYLRIIGLP
ncbi:DUF6292 family protein [Amycolatopsis sp. cmx-8-4]|uniref:DUF6292 family protein n=1 Tax=Amycolatopsis sp. cmx-8-4 TaxID=2790947 RepID=UPI0039793AD8